MGGGRGHIAQVKKLVPFRSFMLLAAVLFLSWIWRLGEVRIQGVRFSFIASVPAQTENCYLSPRLDLVWGIDQSLESFVF